MTKYFLLLIFLPCASFLTAQEAFLTGRITDAQTGEPLIAATISLGEAGTVTNFDGYYELKIRPGEYQLKASYIGYETYTASVTLDAGERPQLDLPLSPRATILETATVTSGKFDKPLSKVTVSLEVLQPGLIENTGKVSIDEALEKLPGVTIIDGQANIRGGSGYSQGAGSRVLLLVDDIPILSADAGFPNWDDVPIENIAQVEVVKGAGSALYGSSALNGIINVRTAYATAEPETEAAVFYTHHFSPEDERLKWWDTAPRTIGASMAHRRKMGKFDLVLGGYYLNEEGYNEGTFRRTGRFNFSTRYRANDRLTIGLNANINAGETASFFYWASDTAAYQPAPNTLGGRQRLRYNIDPTVTYYDGANNRHRILSRFYNINNENDLNQSNFSDMFYAEYQFQRRMAAANMVFTAGLVGSGTDIEAELYGDTTFTSRNLAAYAQLDKEFFGKLNATLGLRYERNVLRNPGFEYDGGVVDPSNEEEAKPVARLGLNYQAGKATFLRASWGQGYRYPTVAEKYIVTEAGALRIVPNPTLESETGWTAELGAKQGFRVSNFEGFLDFAVFRSRYFDMMEFNIVGFSFQAINIGDTQIDGFEITAAGRGEILGLPVSLLAGYTYVDPRFEAFDTIRVPAGQDRTQGQINANNSSIDENILKYRSRHLFKLDLQADYKKASFGVETFYNSQIEAIDAAFLLFISGLQDFRERNDRGFTVVNLRGSYQLTESVKLSLLLNNLLNQAYSPRPGIMEAPRNLTMRLDFDF
ncbi:MAG: TonB-dependent receptor [Phaeodactylibacter sp.]|uniref:TonB-dependent receptor n=1 Tax=Phaeodactylibacter sp. TaxID=1940289 RepID=UPI0032EF735C